MKSSEKTASRCRRVWRWVLRGALALVLLLLLAAGGFAWWLWGWRVGGLTFHESWLPEQRAEMLSLADDLRSLPRDFLHSDLISTLDRMRGYGERNADGTWTWHPITRSQWEKWLTAAEVGKLFAAPILGSLQQVAAEGQCRADARAAGLVAQAACRTLHPALAKELIRRGADVNAAFNLSELSGLPEKAESCFQSAIAGKAYFSDARLPLAERFELLKLMLEHGADVSYNKASSLLSAYISAASETEPDHGAMLEWLLDHGLSIENADDLENAFLTLSCEGTLPAFKRMVQKGHIPLTPEFKSRLLNRIAISPTPDSEQKALWALEELGADPNYILTRTIEDEDEEGNPIETRVPDVSLVENVARYLPAYESDAERQAAALRLLDILLAHGAKLPENAADLAPAEPSLRRRYMEVLMKHGITPQENN